MGQIEFLDRDSNLFKEKIKVSDLPGWGLGQNQPVTLGNYPEKQESE